MAELAWHATPSGTNPNDSVFWAKFDLPQFLACCQGRAKPPINLPETHGLILFSVAVSGPDRAFYECRPGVLFGYTHVLNSLGTLAESDEIYRNPRSQGPRVDR